MTVNYDGFYRLLKRRRILLKTFVRRSGLSDADVFALSSGSLMTLRGVQKVCAFFSCRRDEFMEIISEDADDISPDPYTKWR